MRDLRVEDYTCNDVGKEQYGIQVVGFAGFTIDGFTIRGRRDGVHLNSGRNFTVRRGVLRTLDDGVALNAGEWPDCTPEMGSLENGVVEQITDEAGGACNFVRVITGRWREWHAGMRLQRCDLVMRGPRVYAIFPHAAGTNETVSLVAPPADHPGRVWTSPEGLNFHLLQTNGVDRADVRNVVIRDCYIDSTDDSYCFKSHHADGVSENILVENCVGRSSANGIKFGTMTLGTFKHFMFKNMTIFDTYRSAITIASVDGGYVEDVVVDGLRSIHTGNPIFIRTGIRRGDITKAALKDVVIKNVYAEVPFDKPDAGYNYEGPVEDLPRNICPSSIIAIPGIRVENVRLENVEIVYPGQANELYARRGCTPEELAAIPELEKSYPEFSNWKELPAWGFYVRHADGVVFDNVTLKVAGADYRPAIVTDDVTGLQLVNVNIVDESAGNKNQIVKNNTTETK